MRKKFEEQTPKLLPHDLKILTDIWQYGFRTYPELRENVLKEYSNGWSWKIMKRLVRLKYLTEVKINSHSILGWKTGNVKYLPSDLRDKKSEFKSVPAPKYLSQFNHDKEVRFLVDQITKMNIISEIRTEQELRREALSQIRGYSKRDLGEITSRVPDAAFLFKTKTNLFRVALEVELHHKSKARLAKKLEHYIVKAPYDFVIYICGNDSVYGMLLRNYEHIFSTSPAVRFAEKRAPIYFARLSECKEELVQAKMKHPNDEFRFAQFLK